MTLQTRRRAGNGLPSTIVRVTALLAAGALAAPGTSAAAAKPALLTMPLVATVTQNEGLMKHLFTFQLPAGANQWIGLTGKVSFTTELDYFGEALISVNYYAGPSSRCTALNGQQFPSYSSPGFPALTHLASFIMKTAHNQTLTQAANIELSQPVRVPGCIVVVLDGGGAYGYLHHNGYTVTMSTALTFGYSAIPSGTNPNSIPFPIGGEFSFGPGKLASGSAAVDILRMNPANAAPVALDSYFGSTAASAFDGSSGEVVPTGGWLAKIAASIYPSAACVQAFPGVTVAQSGLFQSYSAWLPAGNAAPSGGEPVNFVALVGNGTAPSQATFFKPTWPAALAPGDCLVVVHRVSDNGVVDLENQSTAMLRPE